MFRRGHVERHRRRDRERRRSAAPARRCAVQPVDSADTTCDRVDDDWRLSARRNCDSLPALSRRLSAPRRQRRGNDTLIGTALPDASSLRAATIRSMAWAATTCSSAARNDIIQGGTATTRFAAAQARTNRRRHRPRHDRRRRRNDRRGRLGQRRDAGRSVPRHDCGGLGIDDLRGNDGSDRLTSARIFNRVDGGQRHRRATARAARSRCSRVNACATPTVAAASAAWFATGICVAPGSVAFTTRPATGWTRTATDGPTKSSGRRVRRVAGVGACARTGRPRCEDAW